MDNREGYNKWSLTYDADENKTRDLEAEAIKDTMKDVSFMECLEIGCGTGKNTKWFFNNGKKITAVDFSEEMLRRAAEKIPAGKVRFIHADITKEWKFIDRQYDLISFSLVLEHIQDLKHIFVNAVKSLKTGGYMYIGELHPYKQYEGTKARFQREEGILVLDCFIHNISEYTNLATGCGLEIVKINEYFDKTDQKLPRIISFLLKKKV